MKHSPHITASTLVSSLAADKKSHIESLQSLQTGLTASNNHAYPLATFVGAVDALDAVRLPERLKNYDCRNHRLAWLALNTDGFIDYIETLKQQYSSHRVGVVLGTSTSGIATSEQLSARGLLQEADHYHYDKTHRMSALADFCTEAMHITGPGLVISTACSSSAKVFATASRWLDCDVVDAVIVGGVDSLCLSTLYGFHSLGLISETMMQPLDINRQGINLGEAAGFMVLQREQVATDGIQLTGFGESSDAYHVSSPHPDGLGAQLAMREALTIAGLNGNDIDYLNLHGTGTITNDLSESRAVRAVFSQHMPLHASTKGFTGHTLGAAGITEAIFCQWALQQQQAFANINLQQLDPALGLSPIRQTVSTNIRHCMSNSFGFGGNNVSLIFSLAGTT